MKALSDRVAKLEVVASPASQVYITDQPEGLPDKGQRYSVQREISIEEWERIYTAL